LDLGSGGKPYRKLFSSSVNHHIGFDRPDSPHGFTTTNCGGDLRALPFKAKSVDTILCTAVLEHCEEPALALAEMNRCLISGGKLILTVPFIWHVHEEPRDFFRYSRFGLQYLLQQAGFEVQIIQPLSGFFGTFGQLFAYQLFRLHRGPLTKTPLIPLLALAVQGLAMILDRWDRSERWPWAYGVIARRP
jgi:SAM-dependent methyltransferase